MSDLTSQRPTNPAQAGSLQPRVVWRIDEDRWWTGRHAVPPGRTVGKALCGRVPWDRWSEPYGKEVAKCEICLKLAPDNEKLSGRGPLSDDKTKGDTRASLK